MIFGNYFKKKIFIIRNKCKYSKKFSYSSDTASSVDNPDLLKETVDTNLIEYSKIVSYLTDKLSYLLNLEEKVNPIESNF